MFLQLTHSDIFATFLTRKSTLSKSEKNAKEINTAEGKNAIKDLYGFGKILKSCSTSCGVGVLFPLQIQQLRVHSFTTLVCQTALVRCSLPRVLSQHLVSSPRPPEKLKLSTSFFDLQADTIYNKKEYQISKKAVYQL